MFENKKGQSLWNLVVIENDRIGGSLVRGIIRADEQSIKVAESPYYSEYKATSIWDKQLRWTADNERSLQAFVEEKLNPKDSSLNQGQPEKTQIILCFFIGIQ